MFITLNPNKSIKLIVSLLVIVFSLFSTVIYANESAEVEKHPVEINSVKDANTIWKLYTVTRNESDLLVLIKYLNADRAFLIASYEAMNRNHICTMLESSADKNNPNSELSKFSKSCHENMINELLSNLTKSAKNKEERAKAAEQLLIVLGIYTTFEAARAENPIFDLQIQSIISKHPELNYNQTINQWLYQVTNGVEGHP